MCCSERVVWRVLLAVAAGYNWTFAVVSGLWPEWFFALFGAGPPEQWRPVTVVVATCGLLYAYAAWRPDGGDVAVTIGLLTKVLGPVAWLAGVFVGTQSPRIFPMVLVGDMLWWLPFVAYLTRRHKHRPAIIAGWSFGAHLVANVLLLVVAPGTEVVMDFGARQRFILDHTGLWVATWMCWTLASMSLPAFCLAWVSQWRSQSRALVGVALAVIAVGVAFDLSGETVLIAQATRRDLSLSEFVSVARGYQILSAAIANGLYCAGGLVLSMVAWWSGALRGKIGVLGFAVWLVGSGLTVAAVLDHRMGLAVCGGGVMLLFVPWNAWLAWRLWQGAESPSPLPD